MHRRRLYEEAERDLKMLSLMIGVMWPEFKENWQPLEFGRGEAGFFPRAFGENVSLLTYWSQPSDKNFGRLAFRTLSELIKYTLSVSCFKIASL